jgi:hypothetical protein
VVEISTRRDLTVRLCEACRPTLTRASPADKIPADPNDYRFEVALPVQIERAPASPDSPAEIEDTLAEVIAIGGALIRCRMAVDKGETVRFRLGPYETRAEVQYVSFGLGRGMDGIQRLGLSFLDAPLPVALIPADARLIR